MKNVILLFIAVLLNSILYAVDSDTIKANNPLIEYTGRIDFTNPLTPGFSYSGASVRACFDGTSLSIILNDPGTQNYYNVILDKAVISRIQTKAGLNTYAIASGLRDTIHEIEIFRLTEETFGKTQFRGFIVDQGKSLVEISNNRNYLIEFIGNSITCGYGNEGINGQGSFGPTTENHFLTYAAITSRSFNARHLAVCKSGIGIYRNYDGPVNGSPDCMTNFYQRNYLYDALPLYSFEEKPDLICINLGTNDFSTNKGDSARFVSKYFDFLDTIQIKNNGADILCLMGPMISGNTLVNMKKYLGFVVDSVNKKNKGNVYLFEMSTQTGNLGIGIDYHPTVAQHLKNAMELTKYISNLKDWQILPIPILGSINKGDEIIINFNTELNDATGNFTGFSVTADDINVPVSSVKPDASDKSKIHVFLSNPLFSGQKINVSYLPGTIAGKDNYPVEKFQSFVVRNDLKETKISKASIDNNGTKLSLTFNKSILAPADLVGLQISDTDGNVVPVVSFSTGASSLDILLSGRLIAGNSYFLTVSSIISGNDKVPLTPVSAFPITNNSTYTSVEEKLPGRISFYPNPSVNKTVNYKIEGSIPGTITANLFDVKGRLLASNELEKEIGMLDFSTLSIQNGSYILKYIIKEKEFSILIIL